MIERKALGVLQTTHQSKLMLTGGKVQVATPSNSRKRKLVDENSTPAKSVRKDGVYEDPVTPQVKRTKLSTTAEIAVQTDVSSISEVKKDGKINKKESKAQGVVDMLTSDKPSEKYWELMALERKSALAEALKENRVVTKECDELKGKVGELQEKVQILESDNSELETLLSEARELARLVESVVQQSVDAEEEKEEALVDIEEEGGLSNVEEENEGGLSNVEEENEGGLSNVEEEKDLLKDEGEKEKELLKDD